MLGISHAIPGSGVRVTSDLHPPQAGRPAVKNRMSKNVMAIALRGERLMAETQIPSAREKKRVLTTTSAMRPNSPPVTPPSKSGRARIGTTASTA